MATKKSSGTPEAEKPAKKAAKKPASSKKPKAAVAETAPASVAPAAVPQARAGHDQVARRAYEIWLARGGSAFENWVEAERQLNGE